MAGYQLLVPVAARAVSAPLFQVLRAAEAALTVSQLHVATAAHPNAIQLRLKRWEREGIVTALSGNPRRFTMTDPNDRTRRASGLPRRRATIRQRLWTAMRVLKRFDIPTLIMTAEATRRSAEDFVNVLCRAGYLKRVTRGNAMTGEWSSYAFQRRYGPLAPKVTHGGGTRVLVDPNDGSRHDVSPGTVSLQRCVGVNHVR